MCYIHVMYLYLYYYSLDLNKQDLRQMLRALIMDTIAWLQL